MPNYHRVFIENSYIFITIRTYKRNLILIKEIDLLRESFKRAKSTYDYEIYASVILPDHMHLILIPKNIKDYPKIIFAVKYHFSRSLNIKDKNLSKSKIKKGEKGIWQRRYWEHTILNEKDLYNHLDYIHYNPIKHSHVRNVKDWEYSSFHKFVRLGYYEPKWGCQDDVKGIINLDFE